MLKNSILKQSNFGLSLFLAFNIIACSSPVSNQNKEPIITKSNSPVIISTPSPVKTSNSNMNSSNNDNSIIATPTPQNTHIVVTQNDIFINGSPVPKPSVVVPNVVPDKITSLKNDVNISTPVVTSAPVLQPTDPPVNKITKGDKIIYTVVENNTNQLYSVNRDGSGRKKISSENKNQSMGTFSNDGTKIYFINSLIDNSNDIYKSDIDGNNLERVTTLAQRLYYPKVSEQNKVLYIYNNQLYLIDSDNITYQLSKSQDRIYSPVWLNNNRIVFLSSDNNFTGNIYSIDGDGKNIKQITSTNEISSFDIRDDVLVYSNIFGIWTSNSNFENKKQIYTDGFVSQVALSPDKNQIVFTSSKSEKKQVYIINIDGSGLKTISDNQESFDPAW